MEKSHRYDLRLDWTGARQGATEKYETYSREYRIEIAGKPAFTGSADPTFRGDATLHNPEDMLLAASARSATESGAVADVTAALSGFRLGQAPDRASPSSDIRTPPAAP